MPRKNGVQKVSTFKEPLTYDHIGACGYTLKSLSQRGIEMLIRLHEKQCMTCKNSITIDEGVTWKKYNTK